MDNAVWLIIKEIIYTQKQIREDLITITDILEEYKYKIRDIEEDLKQLKSISERNSTDTLEVDYKCDNLEGAISDCYSEIDKLKKVIK